LAPTNHRDERGFTLIEVLIAMVILTIAMVSMAELMAITLRMQMMGRNETAAIRLAQSKIDQLINLNFATNTVTNVGGSLTTDVATYFDNEDANFKRRWAIAAIAGETKVRTLTVRVIPNVNDRRTNAQIDLVTIIRSP